jgi:hypothetical protein
MPAKNIPTIFAYFALSLVFLGVSGPNAAAEVVSGTQILWQPEVQHGGNYKASVAQTPAPPGGTQVHFNYVGNTLTSVATTLDEGIDWYLAQAGEVFFPETIAAGQFPLIVKTTSAGWQSNTVNILLGNLYLAASTGNGPFVGGLPPRNVFGWIQLNNTGTELIPIANAVAYNEPGIIIGTTSPAPEPASLALLAPAALLLLCCQKSRSPTSV